MADPLRIGVVGAGDNTRTKHIPGLQAIDGVELVGVCNSTEASSRRVADAFGIPRTWRRWSDVVRDPEVDAVVIGTWPNLHAPVTIAALEAGKHVLCEARMARDAAEARTMLAAARARPELVAQLVPAPLTLGVDATVRRLLAEGYLGELLAVEARVGGAFLNRQAPLSWRQDAELSGVNMMMLGVWYESLMRWVGVASRVVAMARVFAPLRPGADGRLRAVRVPDHVDILAELACGAHARFRVSAVAALGGPDEALLFGSEGTLRFSGGRLSGGRRGDTELAEVPIPDDEREGPAVVEPEFVAAIRGEGGVRLTTFEDGVRYMDFTEGAARSARTGAAVVLPLFP